MARVSVRTIAIYALALVLPFVLFVSLQSAFGMRTLRSQIEAEALGKTREINAAVEGQLRADESALDVLSSSQFIIAHDWPGEKARVALVQAARPHWKNVILTDVATGREIWETRPSGDPGRLAPPWIESYVASGGRDSPFTGVVGASPMETSVAIHVPVREAGTLRFVLTAQLAPQVFEDILLQHAPADSTSAIVDRQGLFIARTVAYATKLGTPATHFVREAIAKGRRGLYPGVTYEGVKNYTAFETSGLTGWSSHVAVQANLLTGPQVGSMLLTGIAALAALILALGIAGYAYRQAHIHRLDEARVAQSEKLAAVGQLAAGIAHDFNNLLMVIGASLERISKRSTDPELRRTIDSATVASERGALLIRQLMAFTRSEPLEIGPVDLTALLGNLHEILVQSVGKAVEVTVDISPDARWVTSSGSQLDMAVVNLAVNARDAMPQGGRLTIRSRRSKGKPEYVDLEVADTGEGMPKAVVDRAMEPFFTTKPLGKGTGLGLAQVFGVVSQSGGTVILESEPGRGTTIVLRLPEATPAGA